MHRQTLFASAKIFVAQSLVNFTETFILHPGFYNSRVPGPESRFRLSLGRVSRDRICRDRDDACKLLTTCSEEIPKATSLGSKPPATSLRHAFAFKSLPLAPPASTCCLTNKRSKYLKKSAVLPLPTRIKAERAGLQEHVAKALRSLLLSPKGIRDSRPRATASWATSLQISAYGH